MPRAMVPGEAEAALLFRRRLFRIIAMIIVNPLRATGMAPFSLAPRKIVDMSLRTV